VQQQLVRRQVGRLDGRIVGEDDAVGAFPQRALEDGDELGGFGDEAVGQLLVVVDQVVDVDVAVELLEERILLELVSVA